MNVRETLLALFLGCATGALFFAAVADLPMKSPDGFRTAAMFPRETTATRNGAIRAATRGPGEREPVELQVRPRTVGMKAKREPGAGVRIGEEKP